MMNCEKQNHNSTTQTDLWLLMSIFLVTASTEAQPASNFYRIAVLSPSNAAGFADEGHALRQSLRELGYIEAQNLLQRLPAGLMLNNRAS